MSAFANAFDGQASGAVLQIGVLNGSVYPGQSERRRVRLLPATTSVFKNRKPEFETLDEWARQIDSGGSRVWNLTGDSGVGKTTLALTWINENRDRFGHAQIAMECGGGSGEGRGRSVEEVCDRYFALAGLATEGHALETPSAKVELLRSMIEERPVALLLDDAQTAAQVLPFLSNLPGLLVIVTSRVPLRGLAQYRPRKLALMPLGDEAVAELLAEILGEERLAAEPGAFAELVRMCEGLPLIAGHAAGLLYDQEDLRIGELVDRMAERGRLRALEEGHEDSMIRPSSVFDVSYRELGPSAARLYRALGLHPVRDFDSGLVTALFAESPADGATALDRLVRRGLVKTDRDGRHLMEDLTYEHATMVVLRDTDPGEREAIRTRIADYYLYAAVAASAHLTQRWTLGPLYGEKAPFALPEFDLEAGAKRRARDPMEWMGDNLAAIIACMERSGRVWDGSGPAPGYRWQLAEATNTYFTHNGRNDERATVLALAEDDATVCQDHDAQARVQAQWGEMLLGQGRLDEARERFLRSLAEARQGKEPRGVGAALEWLGITERRRGDARKALEYLDQAQPMLDPGRKRSQALFHMHYADALAVLGDRPAALRRYATSMALFRELADEHARDDANEGKVLMGQGELLAAEQPSQAVVLFEEAVTRFQAARRPYQEAKALEALGDLKNLGSDAAAASRYWQAALEVYERHGHAEAAGRAHAKLSRTG